MGEGVSATSKIKYESLIILRVSWSNEQVIVLKAKTRRQGMVWNDGRCMKGNVIMPGKTFQTLLGSWEG